jgi:hypothetical protein
MLPFELHGRRDCGGRPSEAGMTTTRPAKTLALAAAVASALLAASPAGAQATGAAASAEDVRQLQEQLRLLADRLDRLERSNRELQSENAQLRAAAGASSGAGPAVSATPGATAGAAVAGSPNTATGAAPGTDVLASRVDALQASVDKTAADLAKTRKNAPDWAGRFSFRGDLRYRYERATAEGDRLVATDGQPAVASLTRDRQRIRFRFGGTFQVNDTTMVGMRLASGGDNPRSANQTLGDVWSRKAIDLDQAYVAWQPTKQWLVRAGKMPMPWTRPGQVQFFDNDLNPEGIAVNYTDGPFFANASYMMLQERGPTVTRVGEAARDLSDPAMGHVQAGFRHDLGEGSTLLWGLSYFDHFAVQGRRPFYAGLSNGNTTVPVTFPAGSTTTVQVLKYDYDVVEAFAQYERKVFGDLPLVAFADFARNGDAELDTAWSVGFTLGRASKPRSWEVGAMYMDVQKDALFGQWVDSNFGSGLTDSRGWIFRAIYAPATNVTLNATYLPYVMGAALPRADGLGDRRVDRVQLDANIRF